jgi:ATP-dependent DNA helicase RecG
MDAVDDDEFSGGLITLLEKGFDFVRTNSKKKWRKTLKGRVEYPEYPLDAVRECLVNGLIHRDYLELGSEVHIDMFDDRVDIYSPGGMIGGVPVQNIADIRAFGSRRRNPIIADLFQRLDLMERRGSGFGKILDAYVFASERLGQHVAPAFVSDPTGFVVTLPNLHYVASHSNLAGFADAKTSSAKSGAKRDGESSAKSSAKSSATRQGRTAGKNVNVIYRAIRDDPHVSIAELQRKTKLSNGGVRKIVAVLKSKGMIIRVGGTNGGHWEVVK